MKISPMENDTPGAYCPGGSPALTDWAAIRGVGKPGMVTIPSRMTWLRSANCVFMPVFSAPGQLRRRRPGCRSPAARGRRYSFSMGA